MQTKTLDGDAWKLEYRQQFERLRAAIDEGIAASERGDVIIVAGADLDGFLDSLVAPPRAKLRR